MRIKNFIDFINGGKLWDKCSTLVASQPDMPKKKIVYKSKRKQVFDPVLAKKVVMLRNEGWVYKEIADTLNVSVNLLHRHYGKNKRGLSSQDKQLIEDVKRLKAQGFITKEIAALCKVSLHKMTKINQIIRKGLHES
jgi:orotate phosphoribosyltransferase-like protein